VLVRQIVAQRPRPRNALTDIDWPDVGELGELADFKSPPRSHSMTACLG
jgi:hypothetical protein